MNKLNVEKIIFTQAFLKQLRFSSNQELFDHLSIEALKACFNLSSSRSLLEPYGRFYYHKSGRVYGKSTNKYGCKFYFQSYLENQNGNFVLNVTIDNTLILEYSGHSQNPQIALHKLLPYDVIERIRTLLKA